MTKEKKELRTNYKDLAKRYKLAERQIWAGLPVWKQQVIVDCRKQPWNKVKYDRILQEYNQAVIELAESEKTLNEKLPPVPVVKEIPELDTSYLANLS